MTQELLPPPAHTPPARGALLVRERAGQGADAPSRGARVTRAVKWPIRKLFKGLYLTGRAVKRHRLTAAILALIVLGLVGSGVIVYRATHPAARAVATHPSGVSGPYSGQTPFTVINAAAPPLPPSLITWMHGHKYFDAHEVWGTYSEAEQRKLTSSGTTESTLLQNFSTLQREGFAYTEFIYSGGYRAPDGSSHYTIEVVFSQGERASMSTLYFLVGADGKIALYMNLTPGG
ncbi:MAG TPA: hypothetical protein VFY89_09370 [Ktedonobacterales bacterium]